MKTIKTKIILFITLLLACASSCTHDTLPLYEDVDRIYFEWASPQIPLGSNETKVNLGYDIPIKSDSTIKVEVLLMGRVSDNDRPIAAEVIKAESSAIPEEDIEILPSFILAGEVNGWLRIKIRNSAKIENTTLMARVRLAPNEYFHTDFTDAYIMPLKNGIEYNVYFDSKTDMPSLWADPEAGLLLTAYFGTYSRVKLQVICEVCGVTWDYFMHDPATQKAIDVLNFRISAAIAKGWISQINRYLRDYQNAHDGNPLLDENGKIVEMNLKVY